MNKKIIFLSLFFLLAGCLWKIPQAKASTFTDGYIRLDNQTANAPLSGTICAQPSSAGAGTEAKISVAFPSDFSISANTSNWTTNVSGLPDGATSWPSIGSSATSVSGQTVTFASGDLTADTLYCFNFTGSSSTTGAAGTNKTGTLTSKNASNATIDQTTYYLAILNNNQIEVTATVPPNATYLPVSLKSTNTGSSFPQNTVLNYKINYGLLSIGAFPLTIQAQWNQGTIAGSPAPSVDIVNYVVGSATNGYGGTAPVVDTVDGTVTWTFTSFPGNTTNQTVGFQLETNNSYTGNSSVSFTVAARAMSLSTVTPDQTVTQDYLYSGSLAPTPTPTQAPTLTPTVTVTPTPTPTLTPQSFAFGNVNVYAVTQSQAQIRVVTTRNATSTITYGTSASKLTQSVSSTTPLTDAVLTLPNLTPDTTYYFKTTATDSYGNLIKSDIFTLKTAVVSEVVLVDPQSVIVTSNSNVLVNPEAQKASGQPQKIAIVVPLSTDFEIQFSLAKQIPVKSIQAIVRNKNVLGANTFSVPVAEAASNYVDLVETQPGVYTGRLKSLPSPGFYEIYARIVDYNGNIYEQKISDLTVTSHFMVYDKSNNQGVDNAKVLLYLYNPIAKIYDLISPLILPIPNPAYSLSDGTVQIVFSPAKYKAEVSAIGYKPQTIEFEINPQSIYYPTVYLQPEPFNLVNFVQYLGKNFTDLISLNQQYLSEISASSRLFVVLESLTLLVFVGLTFFSFSARTHIPILYLPYFFIHKLRQLFWKNNSLLIGKVVDTVTQNPISRARVNLIDAKKNKLLAELKTNRLGEFYYKSANFEHLQITVTKKGFLPTPTMNFIKENLQKMPLVLSVVRDESYLRSVSELIILVLENVIGALLEFLLVFTIILELYFIPPLGILRILPFLFLSILNVTLLIFYLYKPRHLILNAPSIKHGFTAA
ncbi:MAG: hypothetical protein ABSE17_03200 [Candidatus Levyibacteriota bacterium]|jgi:hypothetical protein